MARDDSAPSAARGGHRQILQPGRLLTWSATGAAVGIALSVLDLSILGAMLTVPSLLLLIYSVHALGRMGPDQGPPRRRRRRSRAPS